MTDVSAEDIAKVLALHAQQQQQLSELLAEEKKLNAARFSNIKKQVRRERLTFGAIVIGGVGTLTASVLGVRSWLSGTKQAAPTLDAIKLIDPTISPANQDAFVAAANAATPEVRTRIFQHLNSEITTKNNLAKDFAAMAQSPSLYGTRTPTVDTHFLIQLQNFGGSAATKAKNTNAAVLRDMLQNTENRKHFEDLAKGNPALSHALATLNNNSPKELNQIVAQLSDLEYARLKSISGVSFHDHFEKVFNPHGNGTGGVTTMKAAITQLRSTFKGYGDKFTEQVTKLNGTLQKISPPRTSAALDSQRVLVASTNLEGLVVKTLPAAPPPPNALQQAFSAVQDKMHETLNTVSNTLGSAAKATGKFVQENASALTAASAAVTLVRAHIETTQQNLDAKATFKERAVAALTTNVSVQEYTSTLSQSRYALGLARTVALAAVAITPAAMSIAATIGAIQMTQTVAGGAAAFTKHQMTKTEQRLSALQAEEGAGGAAEQIAKLTERQERLKNRAAALETVANASWGDVSNVAKGTAQHITTAASKTGKNLQEFAADTGKNISTAASTTKENFNNTKDAFFAEAQGIAKSALEATKTVQSCLGNFMARFNTSQALAHA